MNGIALLEKMASAGLSRIWQQMLQTRFGIVSAQQGTKSVSQQGREENNQADADLRSMLRVMGYGFVQMRGLWLSEELQRFVPEDSLFIANISEDDLRKLAQLYGQDSYIYGDGGSFVIRKTDQSADIMKGRVEDYIRQLDKQEPDPSVFSTIQGRKWLFDPNRGKMREDVRKGLEQTKKEAPDWHPGDVVSYVMSNIKIAESKKITESISEWWRPAPWGDCFYCFEFHPKWIGQWGIMGDHRMDVPGGGTMTAYIPLIKDSH